jgi:hypothetical protein
VTAHRSRVPVFVLVALSSWPAAALVGSRVSRASSGLRSAVSARTAEAADSPLRCEGFDYQARGGTYALQACPTRRICVASLPRLA